MKDRQSMKKLKPIPIKKDDKLDEMVALQLKLMNKLGTHPMIMNLSEREQETKEQILAMQAELIELLNEINWKPWKKKQKKVDQHELRFEIIDLFHFLLNIAIIWGMNSEDIAAYYRAKNKENHRRQDNGY